MEEFKVHFRVWSVAQVVKNLPSMYEALSSNPTTIKKEKNVHFIGGSQRTLRVFNWILRLIILENVPL
jgi:hypothetical protein